MSQVDINQKVVTLQSVDISSTLWNEILLVIKNKHLSGSIGADQYEKAIGYYFQARTFYQAAKQDNDYTFPLNLFYAFNNLIKACIYLVKKEPSLTSHGASFFYKNSTTKLNYKNFKVDIKLNGVFGNLLEILPYKKYCKDLLPAKKGLMLDFSEVLKRLCYISTNTLPNDGYIKLRNSVFHSRLFKKLVFNNQMDSSYSCIFQVNIEWLRENPNTLGTFINDHGISQPRLRAELTDNKCLHYLENDNYGNFYLIPKVHVVEYEDKPNKKGNKTVKTRNVLKSTTILFEQLALSYLIALSASSIVRYHGELWNTILRDKDNVESSMLQILLKEFFYSIPLKVLDLLTDDIYVLKL